MNRLPVIHTSINFMEKQPWLIDYMGVRGILFPLFACLSFCWAIPEGVLGLVLYWGFCEVCMRVFCWSLKSYNVHSRRAPVQSSHSHTLKWIHISSTSRLSSWRRLCRLEWSSEGHQDVLSPSFCSSGWGNPPTTPHPPPPLYIKCISAFNI